VRRHLVARFVQALVVAFFAATISFVALRSAPGDPFSYSGTDVPPSVRAHWRHQFGYDRPVLEQYARYVTSVAHGQFGYSFVRGETVGAALAGALPRTLLLTGVALGASLAIGVIVGVVQATHRGRWFDRVSSFVLLVFFSLPDFWGALVALMIFAYWLPIFPPGGSVDPVMHDYLSGWRALWDRVSHLILPASTLTVLTVAGIARYQRSAMLAALPSDYVRTARAKGVSETSIIWRHALRTALTPMITLLGLLFPVLLGGAVFVEKIFSWPGMGLLTTSAISQRDYDVVTASVIVGAVTVAAGSLVADLLQMALDPRVRERS
jgi:peptide/nickel transport system permease protein